MLGDTKELMDTDPPERFLVADALTPVQYRVYPDTPLLEVLDLIVRQRLRVVPVVGEHYEVLGLITAGDALKHLPSRQHSTESEVEPEGHGAPVRARDVMTRSILCVSEEQALTEAANIMVNRDVDQLPVVRTGELVGFLTRKSVLRILFTGQKDS
jgi:CBS domain-containing protein